jgi:hypothetical protein
MRVHKITGARTLSFALAAIGLLAVAAPASSAGKIIKTRVKVTRVVQTESGDYRVRGRVHSPDERCRQTRAVFLRQEGTDWKDRTTRRGKFSIGVPQSEEGSTFRVRALWPLGKRRHGVQCEGDMSRRFRLRPSSEAGIAAAAPASAAAEAKTFKYTSKYQSMSTAHGYPSPGGTARLEGGVKVRRDGGYLHDHLTITEQLAPNVFAFKGKGVDDWGTGEENSGKLRHKFKGTTTVRADGSQRLAIKGHFTGGRVDFAPLEPGGRHRDPSGHYKGSATVAAGSTVMVGRSKGKLRMH